MDHLPPKIEREEGGEKEMEGGERQGQFALSKHRCLLLSSEASHQSRPWALGGDSRKDAPLRSETGWIVYKATRSLLKITVSSAGLVDFLGECAFLQESF